MGMGGWNGRWRVLVAIGVSMRRGGMDLFLAIFSVARRTIKKQTRFFVRIGVISTSYAQWASVV